LTVKITTDLEELPFLEETQQKNKVQPIPSLLFILTIEVPNKKKNLSQRISPENRVPSKIIKIN